ncbi:MAG TPA: outer membrane protein assembly factor BamD, partial [Gemmatimonadales bacterium]|nr:outer membrane protein assembly factor BamD [Gemmatimonadales bacterium]
MSRFTFVALLSLSAAGARLDGQAAGDPTPTPTAIGTAEQAAWELSALAALTGQQRDPADSIYRVARQSLNTGDYQRAAAQFEQVWSRYPRSTYAGDAMYWAAYALHRLGGTRNLQAGL